MELSELGVGEVCEDLGESLSLSSYGCSWVVCEAASVMSNSF